MELTSKMNELITNMNNAMEKYSNAENEYFWALGKIAEELLIRRTETGGRKKITLPLYDFNTNTKPIQWGVQGMSPIHHVLAIKNERPQGYENEELIIIVQDSEYHTTEVLFRSLSLKTQQIIINRMIEITKKN